MQTITCDRCGKDVLDVGPIAYRGQIKLCGRCALEYWRAVGDGHYTRRDLAQHRARNPLLLLE